jgi:hypothetical protein
MKSTALNNKGQETLARQRLPETKRLRRRLARKLERPIGKAFEKSGLNIENDQHWRKLVVLFCVAVYGARGPGQPKKWSKKKLRRLLHDIAVVKVQHPNETEQKWCELLIKIHKNKYHNVEKAKTLRRVLQTAKRLEQDDQLLASIGDELAHDTKKALKKRR